MRVLLITGMLLSVAACGTDEPAQVSQTDSVADEAVVLAPDDAGALAATAADSADVVATVDAFHRALAGSDTAEVRRLLADDVLVLEGGGLEDLEEYLGHHLGADMAFAAAVPGDREVVRVEVGDSLAWLASTTRRKGMFRDREIDSRGVELVVLRRSTSGWQVASVHWSSR